MYFSNCLLYFTKQAPKHSKDLIKKGYFTKIVCIFTNPCYPFFKSCHFVCIPPSPLPFSLSPSLSLSSSSLPTSSNLNSFSLQFSLSLSLSLSLSEKKLSLFEIDRICNVLSIGVTSKPNRLTCLSDIFFFFFFLPFSLSLSLPDKENFRTGEREKKGTFLTVFDRLDRTGNKTQLKLELPACTQFHIFFLHFTPSLSSLFLSLIFFFLSL